MIINTYVSGKCSMRVLLVEDDEPLGRGLETGLGLAGYFVDWMKEGGDAEHAALFNPFTAVLLDINLPDVSGLEVLRRLRRACNTPVIIMTARDSLDDRVEGLDLGADDYIVKPFELKELLARLRAVVRRAHGRATKTIVHQDIEMDMAARRVTRAGKWVHLTQREFQILGFLMERMGRIVSRSDIEAQVYSWEGEIESNAIEAIIYILRKKLGRDLIRTIRGVGYTITLEPTGRA